MSKSASAKEPSGNTGACENVVTPLEAIAIASVSEAEPILPALGITIFPPVVIKPAPVYVPLTSKFALTSTSVAVSSISSVAAISNIALLAP
jgi:hypothetical protein